MAGQNETSRALASAVSAALRDRGISVETAAAEIGMAERTLYRRLSNGKAKPLDLDELADLADLLDLSVVALITYAEAAEPADHAVSA